jgi:predicted nuclease with TOPRIM domain
MPLNNDNSREGFNYLIIQAYDNFRNEIVRLTQKINDNHSDLSEESKELLSLLKDIEKNTSKVGEIIEEIRFVKTENVATHNDIRQIVDDVKWLKSIFIKVLTILFTFGGLLAVVDRLTQWGILNLQWFGNK